MQFFFVRNADAQYRFAYRCTPLKIIATLKKVGVEGVVFLGFIAVINKTADRHFRNRETEFLILVKEDAARSAL